MSNNQPIYEKLKKKYHKTEPITNFKDLLDITKVWVDEGFIRKDAINYQDSSFSALHDQSAFGTFAKYTTLHTNNLKMI